MLFTVTHKDDRLCVIAAYDSAHARLYLHHAVTHELCKGYWGALEIEDLGIDTPTEAEKQEWQYDYELFLDENDVDADYDPLEQQYS